MMQSAKIYRSFRDAAKKLPDPERLQFWDAIMDYSLDGIEPEIDGMAEMLFIAIKPTIDARNEGAEAGKLGGRPRKKTGGFETQKPGVLENEKGGFEKSKTKAEADADADADTDADIKDKRKRFTPPTLEELRSYIREKGYTFDAETFIAYYDSNGWRIGRNPMKDWKAACRTWQQKEKERRKPAVQKVEPRNYDMDELEAAIYRAQSAAV